MDSSRKSRQVSERMFAKRRRPASRARRRLNLPPVVRSRIMARIRGRDTKAELALRRALCALGYRGYRVNVRGVPGTPDLVFARQRVAVFVDGVFWHGHPSKFRLIRSDNWKRRIEGNRRRDRQVNRRLVRAGWKVVRLWDLEILEESRIAAQRVLAAIAQNGSSSRAIAPI